jgi:dihydroneopterin aldolase
MGLFILTDLSLPRMPVIAQIILRQLQVEAAVGLLDWEQAGTQTLEVSCRVELNISEAAGTDSIDHTLDYALLRDAIQSFCRENRFFLLEALVSRLADHLLERFKQANSVELSVVKPAIFEDADGAGVELKKLRYEDELLS